ncbi:UNVERIFIED_CONTAM: hypothetical protein HDU68_009444 [Siphonaria sp. JEL0065]|nr:hypothetical protein HDU68_009444 [Siphonaria sp. JEL0065]
MVSIGVDALASVALEGTGVQTEIVGVESGNQTDMADVSEVGVQVEYPGDIEDVDGLMRKREPSNAETQTNQVDACGVGIQTNGVDAYETGIQTNIEVHEVGMQTLMKNASERVVSESASSSQEEFLEASDEIPATVGVVGGETGIEDRPVVVDEATISSIAIPTLSLWTSGNEEQVVTVEKEGYLDTCWDMARIKMLVEECRLNEAKAVRFERLLLEKVGREDKAGGKGEEVEKIGNGGTSVGDVVDIESREDDGKTVGVE